MTQFVVATVKQAEFLKRVNLNGLMGYRSPSELKAFGARSDTGKTLVALTDRGWFKFERHPERVTRQQTQYVLTDAGKLALELREVLGPDRGLTRAGAKALLKGGATRATRLRLMDDGLWKRSYVLGVADAWLTEDGLKVREILRKYKAEV